PFDYRIVLLLFLALGVAGVAVFPAPPARRFVIAVALFLNPLISTYLWTGRNDIAFVVMVLLCLVCLARGRVLYASLALGIALALKPFAVLAVPFLALALWKRWNRETPTPALPQRGGRKVGGGGRSGSCPARCWLCRPWSGSCRFSWWHRLPSRAPR